MPTQQEKETRLDRQQQGQTLTPRKGRKIIDRCINRRRRDDDDDVGRDKDG
jgi:hypothetical protein